MTAPGHVVMTPVMLIKLVQYGSPNEAQSPFDASLTVGFPEQLTSLE
jgi:hypothetical protein